MDEHRVSPLMWDPGVLDLYGKLEKKFGRNHQLAVAVEELAELQKEVTKAIRGKANDMRIAEEIADVVVCLEQLLMYYDVDGVKTMVFKRFKLERLLTFYVEGEHK